MIGALPCRYLGTTHGVPSWHIARSRNQHGQAGLVLAPNIQKFCVCARLCPCLCLLSQARQDRTVPYPIPNYISCILSFTIPYPVVYWLP